MVAKPRQDLTLQDMESLQNNLKEAKLLFCGYCPLHARRRFVEALVPEAPLDH